MSLIVINKVLILIWYWFNKTGCIKWQYMITLLWLHDCLSYLDFVIFFYFYWCGWKFGIGLTVFFYRSFGPLMDMIKKKKIIILLSSIYIYIYHSFIHISILRIVVGIMVALWMSELVSFIRIELSKDHNIFPISRNNHFFCIKSYSVRLKRHKVLIT